MRQRSWESQESSIEEPSINLTPLIDVVFVVLIAFMIIAPILDVDIVDLATGKPEKQETLPPEQSPLSIVVRSDNSIWMGGQRMNVSELEKILLSQKKMYPHKVPQVIHDKNGSFGTYQTVKNTLEQCGFTQMEIILKPE